MLNQQQQQLYNSGLNSQVYTTSIPLQYSQQFVGQQQQSVQKFQQPSSYIISSPTQPQPVKFIQSTTTTTLPPPPPKQIIQTRIIGQSLEKPIIILNSDTANKLKNQVNELPPIIDNTDLQLLESLNLKIERLIKMENVLNGQINLQISSANAKEVLISQIREQRAKLEEIVRLQSIRIDELKGSTQRARVDLDQTVSILNETEKELHNLQYVLHEKQNVVNQWKARGTEVERLNSDVNLLQSQLNQLQAQNQVLRNNIRLDPSFNYLII